MLQGHNQINRCRVNGIKLEYVKMDFYVVLAVCVLNETNLV